MAYASHRLFIALPVDDENSVISLKNSLGFLKKFNSSLKIVSPENYHITLKFFGAVNAGVSDTLIKDFSLIAGLKKIEYRIDTIGAFPSRDNPSVIWAGLKCDEKPLDELIKSVEALSSLHGFPPEERKFLPHLTLARVRRETKVSHELIDFIKDKINILSVSSVFRELVLYESILKKTGPEYKKIEVIHLD
jgi:RNA 2',3'-cyclic 3'-phosphodiesterase